MRKQILVGVALASLIFVSGVFAEVLLNYMPPGESWGPGPSVPHGCLAYGGGEYQYAIKYVAEGNWHINTVSYYAKEVSDFGSTFYVYVNVVHGGSTPNGGSVIATSANVDVNTWGSSPAFRPFSFSSGFDMIQGDTYWFVARAYSTPSGYCDTAPTLRSYTSVEYSSGKTDSYYSTTGGSSWTIDWGTTAEAPLKLEGVVTLHLGFPLAADNGVMGYHFDDAWQIEGSQCPNGVWKRHAGVDYTADVDDEVYAAEDGVVKHVQSHSPFAYHIVIEHSLPSSDKYTTVYWHVYDPEVSVNDNVTKGQLIAKIADISPYGSHLHFGAWMGDYATYGEYGPAVGALPVDACSSWPAFPAGFVDPEDTDYVVFE